MQQCAECNKGLLVTPLLYCFIMHTMFHAGRPAGRPARQRPSDGGAAAAALRTSHRFPTVPNVPQMMMPFFISARFAQLATYKTAAAAPHLAADNAAPCAPRRRHVGRFVDVNGNAAGWRLVSKKCQLGQNVFTCGIKNCKNC